MKKTYTKATQVQMERVLGLMGGRNLISPETQYADNHRIRCIQVEATEVYSSAGRFTSSVAIHFDKGCTITIKPCLNGLLSMTLGCHEVGVYPDATSLFSTAKVLMRERLQKVGAQASALDWWFFELFKEPEKAEPVGEGL